jgi:hypothetical protein
LGDKRRGAKVYRDTETRPGRKSKGRLVSQDGGIPLAKLDDQVIRHLTLAGQTPSVRNLSFRELLALGRVDGGLTLQDADLAPPAAPVSAAREFHALVEQQIPKRCALSGGQFGPNGLQDDTV